jgi:hypothetical protein
MDIVERCAGAAGAAPGEETGAAARLRRRRAPIFAEPSAAAFFTSCIVTVPSVPGRAHARDVDAHLARLRAHAGIALTPPTAIAGFTAHRIGGLHRTDHRCRVFALGLRRGLVGLVISPAFVGRDDWSSTRARPRPSQGRGVAVSWPSARLRHRRIDFEFRQASNGDDHIPRAAGELPHLARYGRGHVDLPPSRFPSTPGCRTRLDRVADLHVPLDDGRVRAGLRRGRGAGIVSSSFGWRP